jgi:hypothetical protein
MSKVCRVRAAILPGAALAVIVALAWAPAASADLADETALAERYAPVVRLVAQAQECGYGESYRPLDVDVLFGEPTVALRGPWGGADLVKIAPKAADLSADRYEYHLDFPGNPLDPGCGYERWARFVTRDTEPTVYAHVATDPGYPGKLSLQYWLYYAFNDWNNTHEGDWEMIQLVFDADDAGEALGRTPTIVGYSQHEGAEQATWGEDKLELVGGTHAVVHPAAGSHANFYEEALFLGRSGSEGVGCDDTNGPTFDLRPAVKTIPSDPAAARAAFPWIAFEGRWASSSERSSTGQPARTSRRNGLVRFSGRRASGATAASPSQGPGLSGPAPRTSSATRSPQARTRYVAPSRIQGQCSSCSWGLCFSSASCSLARRGGRVLRCGSRAAAHGARS